MISWLKKHFIPHEGNEHRPHILRDYSVRNIAALVIVLEILFFIIPIFTRINVEGGMAAVLPAVLSELTNSERQTQNLPTLSVNPILNKAAEMKAEDMAARGYFAHTSPEGKTPWYWLSKVGYHYQYAGENLAINFSDSKDVTLAWMKSPTHKANIVKGNYTEVGTGIATGMYEGRETVFVAQVYANPLPKVFEVSKNTNSDVEKVKNIAKSVKKEVANVLGAEVVSNIENIQVKNIIQPTVWQKLLASPRNTTNVILYIVFGMMAFALLLYVFIKAKNHHRDLITNGLVLMAVVGAIFVMNFYLSHNSMTITDSLDYSSQL